MKSNDAPILHSPGKAEKLLAVSPEDQLVMPHHVDVGHVVSVVEYLSRAQGVSHTQV
jgi:hypothetical protein